MDKLFLRVYLQLLAAMLLFCLLFRLIIVPYADRRVTQNIEESFSPPVGLAAALLAEHYASHHDFGVFQGIAARSSYELALLPDRGSGLGLAIVRRIAEQHSGEVSVQDSQLGGACFRLALPAASTPTAKL